MGTGRIWPIVTRHPWNRSEANMEVGNHYWTKAEFRHAHYRWLAGPLRSLGPNTIRRPVPRCCCHPVPPDLAHSRLWPRFALSVFPPG